MDEDGLSFIEISCGDVFGELYLENLRKVNIGKGMEKCILHNGKMITPHDFETVGGKRANKAWKKSIKHKNKPLSKFFSSGALKEFEPFSVAYSKVTLHTPSAQIMPVTSGYRKGLEVKLTKSIERVVKTTMTAFKSSFE